MRKSEQRNLLKIRISLFGIYNKYNVVYTVTNPNNPSSSDPINGQLVYGETVTPSYRPDGVLTDGHYGVITTIDGKTITDGNVYDNYRYHYDGDVTLSMPNKPDFEPPVNPPVTPGTGTVTPLPEQPTNPSSNTPENTTETTGHKTVWDGERDRGGDRPEDKRGDAAVLQGIGGQDDAPLWHL